MSSLPCDMAMIHITPLEHVAGACLRLATRWLKKKQLSLDIITECDPGQGSAAGGLVQ